MRTRASIALLLPLACLLGCTLPTTPSTTPADTWENWQIQAGAAITSPPNTYPSFLGAIEVQGTQAAGIFTTVYAPGTPTPSSTVEDYAGSFVASTENVTLATFGYGFGYTQPATPYTIVPVSVIGGCVYPPTYTGPECLALIALAPSVGVQIAPLNGIYTGTLTGTLTTISPATSTPITGTASVTFTQSTTPNSSGQFPLTATVTFPSASGLATASLGGTVSGEGIALSYYSAAVIGPGITLAASTNPTATQITVSNLSYIGGGTDIYVTLTGTLTLQ
jgi:hypothetical protein